ncbi:hypothetical protein CPB86DRAFT_715846 [Serendipita vermifera]|nr:hypothetical protein CPB86DRAFT_715846 [Serendipita vermifera]
MKRLVTGPVVLLLLITAFVLIIVLRGKSIEGLWLLRGDPDTAARRIVSRWPVIDGHVDLPALYRGAYANNISAVDLRKQTVGHVDIPRLREGGVGSFWWSTWVACPGDPTFNGNTSEADFIVPSWRVRDTLEQIDVAKLIMEQYPETFQLALSVDDARGAMQAGRIAGWIGVEGGHQLGNSLGVLRQYYALGVRYMTLTHTCHNAFADSGGFLESLSPLHYGLSPLGKELITEMNRLGMIVDLSHTSDQTAIQALTWSRAPVMWSHSSSREVWNVARNVPNEILARLGTGPNQRDGVVMINFAPYFVAEKGKATVEKVADHVEMIAKIAGKKHVGLGSDFDGIKSTPIGLEDVSKYPNLVAILIRRGWTASELSGLLGGNMLRVFDEVERIAKQMRAEGAKPSMALYSKRPDLPAQVTGRHTP